MRIGIDARFFGPRGKGLGRYTQKLIESLQEIDNQNDYVIFLRRENFNEFQPQNPRFKKVLADYRWYSVAEQIFLPFVIYRQKIDLMHFPHFNVPVLYFKPFVVTIHDLILRHFATRRASTLGSVKYWFKNLAYRAVFRLAISRAKKIITVSQYVRNDIIKCFKIKPEKIVMTHEGVPQKNSKFKKATPPLFPSAKAYQNSKVILEKYGINKLYLLYVGNAYPHKNLERLLGAFKILVEDFKKDIQLVLAGEEDYFYRRLESCNILILRSMGILHGEQYGRVIFTGFVPDEELAGFYKNASAYVFPSLCEGFGLPSLEAMSQGVPVVSSGATCLPEILGEAAVYFDPLNPRDMAEKINQVLADENLRRGLISKGFEQIKKYSWRKMGEETLNIYSNVNI
ncbi:glycosyltransferase family 4 protein [Patescibacteria group bacterium]|nr:glycosyltransferase family 4 protein [Patescibacteria group bacterium]